MGCVLDVTFDPFTCKQIYSFINLPPIWLALVSMSHLWHCNSGMIQRVTTMATILKVRAVCSRSKLKELVLFIH